MPSPFPLCPGLCPPGSSPPSHRVCFRAVTPPLGRPPRTCSKLRDTLPAPPFAWSTSASAHASARLLCTQRLSESRDKACSGPQYRVRGKACQVIGFSCQFLLPTPARWLSRSLLKAQAKVSEASLCDFFCPVFTKCQPFRRPDALFRPVAGLQAIER